jgi:HEAT repeat protein
VAPAEAAPQINAELAKSVEDFWHYASIARYDLAKAEGDKIAAAAPAEVLAAFEAVLEQRNARVPADRRVELDERLLSWQRTADLKDTAVKLLDVFSKARLARAADMTYIESQVERLGGGRRAYVLAIEHLKNSGELAVPVMLAYLKDPAKKNLHVEIRSAIRDLGQRALNPLLAATDVKEPDLAVWVMIALGDIGYDAAVPYLVRVTRGDAPVTVKAAAAEALSRLNARVGKDVSVAQLFYGQAVKYYYDKGAVRPEKGVLGGYMWYWNGNALEKKDIPPAVFHDDMALRMCEQVLKADPSRSDALALWLAAGYQRESEMPEGAADPFWDEKHPSTHFYAVAAGTRHTSAALARALNDKNAAVALRAVKSLQEIVGASNLYEGQEVRPLLDALRYPDRQVRFEAALAVAQSLPQKNFTGQERVIPILAEALNQSGKPGVLVLASEKELNGVVAAVGANNAYQVKGGATPEQAVAAAAGLSGVDVIIAREGDPGLDRLFELASQNIRLERASRLILVASKNASPFATIALTNPLVTATDVKLEDAAALTAAVDEARKRSGGLPLDEKAAGAYAQRAADMVARLAISRGQVFDLTVAQPALIAALDDARPEIAKASGAALGYLNTRESQMALAVKACDEKTADELRIALLKDLAISAKFSGNQLEPAQIDAVIKLAQTSPNNDVRSAAAEALGAMNLASEKVKTFINDQAK